MRHYIIREDRFREFLNKLVGKKSARQVMRVVGEQIQVVDMKPGDRALTSSEVVNMINDVAASVRSPDRESR